jgi:DNA-directed RNA polymerase subunit RPC12/RpoP
MSVMMCHGCRAKVMLQEDRETFCPKCDTQLTIKTPAVIFVRSAPGEAREASVEGKVPASPVALPVRR